MVKSANPTQRAELENNMRQAFMRGVCALNLEAMNVMRGGAAAAAAAGGGGGHGAGGGCGDGGGGGDGGDVQGFAE